MKIEFKKLPFTEKDFTNDYNSVKLEGTFCKISPSLAKVDAKLAGETTVDCCRCGDEYAINVDEDLNLFISDGVYKNTESDDLVIEIEDNIIDFDEICESELSSMKSDYHICKNCENDQNDIEQEL